QVLELEGDTCPLTIGTPSAPLLQEVFADFVASERPLLVRYPAELRVLQQLGVAADELQGEGSNRGKASQPLDPGEHVLEATLQRGRQLPPVPPPVGEAGRARARVPLPRGAPPPLPRGGAIAPPFAAVAELCGPQHPPLPHGLVEEREPGRLAPRIEL